MGENSAISWTRHTWNPWIGCAKVSPACDGCSAEALMDKHYGPLQVKGGQWPTDKPGFCRINLDGERADDGWPMQRVGRKLAGLPALVTPLKANLEEEVAMAQWLDDNLVSVTTKYLALRDSSATAKV